MNAAADTVVKLVGVSRLYRQGASVVHALQHINLEIRKGDFAVLVGPSGSGKSTLLQVLISIQSMILCDEPFLNEPGWANQGGSPASKACTLLSCNSCIHTISADPDLAYA